MAKKPKRIDAKDIVTRYASPFDPAHLQWAECTIGRCEYAIHGMDYTESKPMMLEHRESVHQSSGE